jgi:predicted DNA-binding transcriptional regulator AlpA
MKPRFGTLRAVAEYLGKSERTVWRMVQDGRLPKPVPGFGYDWDDVNKAIDNCKQRTAGAAK